MTTENKPSTVNIQPSTDSDEISLKELIEKLQSLWKYLFTQWMKIVVIGLFGGMIGFVYAYRQPVKYIAKMTFVVEDAKSSGGGLASLAGQFGFDIGGGGGGNVLSGDNILMFFKSRKLVRETLLTSVTENDSSTLADVYSEINKIDKSWNKKSSLGDINFNKFKSDSLPRQVDSILQIIEGRLINESLSISRPDKKASFVDVKMISINESFSKLFLDRLVKVATEHYLDSKIKNKVRNVAMLQKKVDSLALLLNDKTYSAAASQQSLIDANPALKTNTIGSEISLRDKTLAASIFSEVVKNLELSKTLLSQEMPVIQIVDQSTFPLQKEVPDRLRSFVTGILVGSSLMILFFIVKRWVKNGVV